MNAHGSKRAAASSRGQAPVRVSVLGPLTVTVGGSVSPQPGPTLRRLITALVIGALERRPCTIDALTDAVYRGDPPARGRRSIATLIWRLRQRWGSDAIESDRYRYWLAPERCVIDAREFERELAAARTHGAADRPDALITGLSAALSWWNAATKAAPGGDPTAALAVDPADIAIDGPTATRLIELRDGAAEQLADACAAAGRHRDATALLERLAERHPSWEHSQALLIRSLLAIGDVASAARRLDVARRSLVDNGIEPGSELADAASQVERSARGTATTAIVAPAADRAARHGRSRAPGPALIPRPRGTEDLWPADLVGRDAVLNEIVEHTVTGLRTGRPTTVVVTGEAGIGKSTVTRSALLEVHRALAPVIVRIDCDRRRTLPYGPLLAIAAALQRESDTDGTRPAARPDDAEYRPAGASRLAVLLAETRPVDDIAELRSALVDDLTALATDYGLVLAIDDLHWAPDKSQQALADALAHCAGVPISIVATSRSVRATTGLAAIADHVIELGGLTQDDVAEIASLPPRSAEAERMYHLTGGNPLFVHQLRYARDDRADGLPADLQSAIRARLEPVPESVRSALRLAAVVGDTFEVLTLAALSGPVHRRLPEWQSAAGTALQFGLVRPAGAAGRFRFTHGLVARYLYRELAPADRVSAHAAVAGALERLAVSHPLAPDLMAYHRTRGWPEIETAAVVDALVAAARAAGVQLDFAQAARQYRSALDYTALDPGAVSAESVAEIIGAAAGAAAAAGDIGGAAELYASLERHAASAGLQRWRVFAALGLLRTQYLQRCRQPAAAELVAAVEAATALSAVSGAGSADAAADLSALDIDLIGDAVAAVQVYRPDRARELITRLSGRYPDSADRWTVSVWEHLPVARQQTVARQIAEHRAAIDPDGTDSLTIAAWLRRWVADVAAGTRAFDDEPARMFPLAAADDQTSFDLAQWHITRAIATGRLARAQSLIDEALAGPRHSDPAERARRAASFYGQAMFLALTTGQTAAVRDSPIVRNPTWVSRHPMTRYIAAHLKVRMGVLDGAHERCAELVDEVRDGDIPESDLLPRVILLTDLCLRISYRDGLGTCLAILERHRGAHGIFRFGQYWGIVDQSIGDIHVATGDIDGAIVAYRSAVAGLERAGARLHVPGARRGLAVALERRGGMADLRDAAGERALADSSDRNLGLTHRIGAPGGVIPALASSD